MKDTAERPRRAEAMARTIVRYYVAVRGATVGLDASAGWSQSPDGRWWFCIPRRYRRGLPRTARNVAVAFMLATGAESATVYREPEEGPSDVLAFVERLPEKKGME